MMAYLEGWVSQLILIVLFAVILELLLPSGSFRKYVKFVIGLVLIVALLDPVIRLFHMDPAELIQGLNVQQEYGNIQNETVVQKKEIEKAQEAYIQEQVAVQLKKRVEEGLNEQYGMQINDLEVSARLDDNQEPALQKIEVVLGRIDPKDSGQSKAVSRIRPVDDVSVSLEEHTSDSGTRQESAAADKIRSFLARQWEIDSKLISLRVEGEK